MVSARILVWGSNNKQNEYCGLSPVRFLLMELIYTCLNLKFDTCVIFMTNYFLVGDNILVDSDALLVIDFMNLKIKSAQSFEGAHMSKLCMRVLI
jgi:hypothetical protein